MAAKGRSSLDAFPVGGPYAVAQARRRGRGGGAVDSYITGVTPDLEVRVRLDVLEEIDFLAERYALFRRAS